jgi:hypothetical protein
MDTQWPSGMIPSMVFMPSPKGAVPTADWMASSYFPGPGFWRARNVTLGVLNSKRTVEVPSSGIAALPLHGTFALEVYLSLQRGKGEFPQDASADDTVNDQFMCDLLQKLYRSLMYFHEQRTDATSAHPQLVAIRVSEHILYSTEEE